MVVPDYQLIGLYRTNTFSKITFISSGIESRIRWFYRCTFIKSKIHVIVFVMSRFIIRTSLFALIFFEIIERNDSKRNIMIGVYVLLNQFLLLLEHYGEPIRI